MVDHSSIAAHCDPCCGVASATSRTAFACCSGENLIPGMTPHPHESESLRKPVRFRLESAVVDRGVSREQERSVVLAAVRRALRAAVGARANGARPDDADLARVVVENTAVLLLMVDAEARIILFNRACEQVLGWPAAEVIGRPFWDVFVPPADVPRAQEGFRRQMSTGRAEVREAEAVDRNGTMHHIRWQNSLLLNNAHVPERLVLAGVDVSEQRRADALLRERAETDSLTGLLNRASLLDALEQYEHLGILFCDLDGFKTVNDRYGHAAGDALLKEVAQRLRHVVRERDLVARIGGDEFVVLCPTQDGVVMDRLAARVCTTASAPIDVAGVMVQVGISVGVALRVRGEPAHAVLAAADAAMYQAKRTGRGLA